MKFPRAYNFGSLVWEPEMLRAYALYFHRFVEAYRAAGLPVTQVHVQNEPDSDQKFPSCKWTGEKMRDFVRDYLGPLFRERPPGGKDCEIWAGTIERGDYAKWAGTILEDDAARQYLSGVGFQWAGKAAVQRTHACWPSMRLLQTENECGDGANTWEYAGYVFDLAQHYISNGVNGYVYWNMVLPGPNGGSTWGWAQNSMISVDLPTKRVTYNPEYYVMQILASVAEPGSVRMGLKGRYAGNAVAFRSADGSRLSIAARNPFAQARIVTISLGAKTYHIPMEPEAMVSITLAAGGRGN